jgi:amidase
MDASTRLDALAQADLVRRKEVTPLELVDAAIACIERLNPRLNAVVTDTFERARAQARGPLPAGPLTGVPFLLKDLIASDAGVPTQSGSAFLRGWVPDHDSELVARYKRAGLIILGKTNTPELGLLPTTEPRLHGPTRNPWDESRTVGGSSGGSAVAVASGMVPMAHGSDGGGSLRIPASCCGLVGFKPTRARMPTGPDLGEVMHGLLVEHALTLSVRDCAALLDATEGPDTGAPYMAPPKARPFLREVGAAPGRLRIAFTTRTSLGMSVDPECQLAVESTARLLAELGHTVEEGSLAVDEEELLLQSFIPVWASGAVLGIEALARQSGRTPQPELFEPLTWALYEMGRSLALPEYLLAVATMQRLARSLATHFLQVDAWVTPTLTSPPVPLGSFEAPQEQPLLALMSAAAFVAFTPLANMTGQPAVSLPLHWSAEGLPVGVQLIGRYGEEATLFRLAAQLEAARPWAGRRPPLFG